MNKNYHRPLNTQSLMSGQKLPKVDVAHSIYDHIKLILATQQGDFGYDNSFGCSLWERDFDVSVEESNWVSEMTQKMQKEVLKFESRILPTFSVNIKIEKKGADSNLKQSFNIEVKNIVIQETNEKLENFTKKFTD